MPEERSLISIGLSCGNAKIALNRGKKPQKMEKKNKRPICYKIIIVNVVSNNQNGPICKLRLFLSLNGSYDMKDQDFGINDVLICWCGFEQVIAFGTSC